MRRWIKAWRRFFRPIGRHWAMEWDGTHATCACGYNNVNDWDLSHHMKEVSQP